MIETSNYKLSAAPRILITGASGFVGTGLVQNFLTKSSFSNLRLALRKKGVSRYDQCEICFVGDINPSTNWQEALQDVEVVIHLAARVHVMDDTSANSLEEYREANTFATIHLAEESAKAGVKRFIYLSSIKVNGEATKPGESYSEGSIPNPQDPYGVSKLEAEYGLQKICSEAGMEYVIIRPPLIYGPGVKANFRKLMGLVYKGIPLPFGGIHNQRSMLALENLVDFIGATIANPLAANQIFLLSDGKDLSTARLLELLAKGMGKSMWFAPIPSFLLRGFLNLVGKASVAGRLLGSLQINSSKAHQLLNWKPPLSVENAVQLTAQSYLKENAAGRERG